MKQSTVVLVLLNGKEVVYNKEDWSDNCMNRVNKTKNNLQEVWNDLDLAYENMEKAFEKMAAMVGLPDELEREINNFDMSAISSLKQHIEIMMEGLVVGKPVIAVDGKPIQDNISLLDFSK